MRSTPLVASFIVTFASLQGCTERGPVSYPPKQVNPPAPDDTVSDAPTSAPTAAPAPTASARPVSPGVEECAAGIKAGDVCDKAKDYRCHLPGKGISCGHHGWQCQNERWREMFMHCNPAPVGID